MCNFGHKKKFSKHIILILQKCTTFLSVAFLTYFHFKINMNNKPLTLQKLSIFTKIMLTRYYYYTFYFLYLERMNVLVLQ